ncbi:SHOCT domain-containing protein [Nocardia sp. NPDC046473]|uniref:SHOCT domain-containing protein n=1 Tax=Nocardia sp. NPDC046473 TaxID=3155733 RepID=UPI0034088BFC
MMWSDGYGWGGWILMGAIMVLFWGLVIVAGFAAVHYLRTANSGGRSEPGGGRGTERAEVLLAERLARGEIDEDDYRNRLALLRETQS